MRAGEHVFDRSGLAALSDLQTPEWKALFQQLERVQAQFLAHENTFRSPEYRWPRDPLHTWNRVWEYPYVYHHIREWRSRLAAEGMPRVADIGSGVTFLPFAVARLGCKVTCVDVDAVCEGDMGHAAKVVDHRPGTVDFALSGRSEIPLPDRSVDAVYCISVLEHIACFDETVNEMARILKPDGLLILTVDIDIHNRIPLDVRGHCRLLTALETLFSYRCPVRSTHPADVLHTMNSRYTYFQNSRARYVWFLVKQWVLKPLLLRKPIPVPMWTVEGFVLRRKC